MANEVNLESICKDKENSDKFVFPMTARRYRVLAADGIVPPVVAGKIDFVKATKDLLIYYQKLAAGQGTLTLTDERVRLTKINADRKELQLQKEKGALLHTEKAMQLWGQVAMVIKHKLLALPVKLAPLLIGARTLTEAKAVIDRAIGEVLTEISNPNLKNYAVIKEEEKEVKKAIRKKKAAKKK